MGHSKASKYLTSNDLTTFSRRLFHTVPRRALVALGGLAAVGVSACRREVLVPVESTYVVRAVGGSDQRGPAGSVLADPLSIEVRDGTGAPVKNARIVYRVQRGAAGGAALLDSIGVSSPEGIATARLRLGRAGDTVVVSASPANAPQRAATWQAIAVGAPTLVLLSSTALSAGDTLTLVGPGLGASGLVTSVLFGSTPVAPLGGGTDGAVRAVVPPCLDAGPLTVRVVAGPAQSNALAATYATRSAALTLAPFQSITVGSAQIGQCLRLAGGGASYLAIPQFASVGTPLATTDWRLGAGVAGTAGGPANAAGSETPTAAQRFDAFLRGNEARIAPQARAESQALGDPGLALQQTAVAAPALGTVRAFKVVSALDGSSFANVGARLRYVGQHLLLYVDTIGTGFNDAQYAQLGSLFDKDLYGVAVGAFGSESDIDRDGRINVLFTPVVNSLVKSVDCRGNGYVTGFFYGTDLLIQNTGSNKAEVFYSFIPDSAGIYSCPHTADVVMRTLPGTFIHEMQHMISFNQHVLARGGDVEETWLNEGLSHIAEELGSMMYETRYPPPSGRSTTTQLFPDSANSFIAPQMLNAYVYLNNQRNHSVTSYYGGGSVEERGATWLFLRWLISQKGDDLPKRLVQTAKTGIANVEEKTGEPFGALFGDFSVALFADSLPGFSRATVPVRYRFGVRNIRQLMAREAVTSGFSNSWPLPLYSLIPGNSLQTEMVSGTMIHSLLQSAPGGAPLTLRFTRRDLSAFAGTTGAQVTIFRLP
jgi:hypothetical protein